MALEKDHATLSFPKSNFTAWSFSNYWMEKSFLWSPLFLVIGSVVSIIWLTNFVELVIGIRRALALFFKYVFDENDNNTWPNYDNFKCNSMMISIKKYKYVKN